MGYPANGKIRVSEFFMNILALNIGAMFPGVSAKRCYHWAEEKMNNLGLPIVRDVQIRARAQAIFERSEGAELLLEADLFSATDPNPEHYWFKAEDELVSGNNIIMLYPYVVVSGAEVRVRLYAFEEMMGHKRRIENLALLLGEYHRHNPDPEGDLQIARKVLPTPEPVDQSEETIAIVAKYLYDKLGCSSHANWFVARKVLDRA